MNFFIKNYINRLILKILKKLIQFVILAKNVKPRLTLISAIHVEANVMYVAAFYLDYYFPESNSLKDP